MVHDSPSNRLHGNPPGLSGHSGRPLPPHEGHRPCPSGAHDQATLGPEWMPRDVTSLFASNILCIQTTAWTSHTALRSVVTVGPARLHPSSQKRVTSAPRTLPPCCEALGHWGSPHGEPTGWGDSPAPGPGGIPWTGQPRASRRPSDMTWQNHLLPLGPVNPEW